MSNSFQKEFEDQSLQALYRKMKKTAKARFGYAQRLKRHHTFTLWSMSLFSAGLIVLSLLPNFTPQLQVSTGTYQFLQFILSLFVLVISILLGSSNYSDRSEKMHRCALEINGLCHEILPSCKENSDHELYKKTLFRYSNILDAYENHEPIDFAFVKLDLPEDYTLTKWQKFMIPVRYWFSYWIHAVLMAVLVGVFAFVLIQTKRASKTSESTPAVITSPAVQEPRQP
jgi:hypothetical protein